MNKTIITISIVYIILFTLGGYFFYTRYFQHKISFNDNTIEINPDIQPSIYYNNTVDLFQLNPDALSQNLSVISKTIMKNIGSISFIDLDKDKNMLIIEAVNKDKLSEIWQFMFSDYSSTKLFSSKTPGLETFSNFTSPHVSPDNINIVFIAKNADTNYLYSYNIPEKTYINLTPTGLKGQISDVVWSQNGQSVIYNQNIDNKAYLKVVDFANRTQDIWSQDGEILEVIYPKSKILYLSKTLKDSQPYYSINMINIDDGKNTIVTDVSYPKVIDRFNVSNDGLNVSFEVRDTSNNNTDIYLVNSNATNLLQLTTDGKSYGGLFSPSNDKVAYWVKDSGFFTSTLNKLKVDKILNDDKGPNNILIWE